MKPAFNHHWDLTPAEASTLQSALRTRVRRTADFGAPARVAGVDVAVKNGIARAAIVVLDYPSLDLLDWSVFETPVTFPYVPGLLAFRELPAVLRAVELLKVEPHVFVVDGHGLAHPRRFGIACHLGVVLDTPSIGCAKSRLIGAHAEPGVEAGAWTELCDGNEVLGAVVRTRTATRPVYVSIGHRVDLPTAVGLVLQCTRGYRLPETSRLAHQTAGVPPVPTRPGWLPAGVPG